MQSNQTNATGITFGSSKRDSSRTQTQPSPAEYDPENIRNAIMLTKSKMPSIRFGDPPKKARKKRSKANSPSPAEYDTEALRKGVFSLSSKRRPVGIKFSTGPRTYNDMEERERKRTPGPQSYNVPSALGNQVNSRYRSQPSLSFGAR